MTRGPASASVGTVPPQPRHPTPRGHAVSTPVLTALPETPPRQRAGAVVSIARWSATHRWTVVALWLVGVVLTVVLGSVTGTRTLTGAQSGSGESGRADVVLDDAGFP